MKRYNRTFNNEKTILPRLFSLFRAIPKKYLYFEKYDKLRHPGGILERATGEIVKSMNKVLIFLDQIIKSEKPDKPDKIILQNLLDAQKELIGNFDSFQDSCYLILKGLCPPPKNDNAANDKFVSVWLSKNGFNCSSNFRGRTGNIQKYVDIFSNGLKHGNQKFDYVVAKCNGYYIPGIFIEELKGKDIKNVYRWIPKRMAEASIAFSFNYILKTLVLCFYEICDDLEITIKEHIKSIHQDSIPITKNIIDKHSNDFETMIIGVSNLKNIFYPYEYKKFTKIVLQGHELRISYPHSDRYPYSSELKATAIYDGDGHSNTICMPFFG